MVPLLLLEQKYDCPRSIEANPKNTSKYIIIIHMKWWYNKTIHENYNTEEAIWNTTGPCVYIITKSIPDIYSGRMKHFRGYDI